MRERLASLLMAIPMQRFLLLAKVIYYYLFDPEQGFAVQCVYTADGSVDEAYRVQQENIKGLIVAMILRMHGW